MEQNLSFFDTKLDTLEQEKQRVIKQILDILAKVGIQTSEIQEESGTNQETALTFETVMQKLEQLLSNYKEDQRQMQTILADNSKFHTSNEELNNSNYDLRYELQELNIKFEKAQE